MGWANYPTTWSGKDAPAKQSNAREKTLCSAVDIRGLTLNSIPQGGGGTRRPRTSSWQRIAPSIALCACRFQVVGYFAAVPTYGGKTLHLSKARPDALPVRRACLTNPTNMMRGLQSHHLLPNTTRTCSHSTVLLRCSKPHTHFQQKTEQQQLPVYTISSIGEIWKPDFQDGVDTDVGKYLDVYV